MIILLTIKQNSISYKKHPRPGRLYIMPKIHKVNNPGFQNLTPGKQKLILSIDFDL